MCSVYLALQIIYSKIKIISAIITIVMNTIKALRARTCLKMVFIHFKSIIVIISNSFVVFLYNYTRTAFVIFVSVE